jgi:hypothetical protein
VEGATRKGDAGEKKTNVKRWTEKGGNVNVDKLWERETRNHVLKKSENPTSLYINYNIITNVQVTLVF